MGRQQFRSIAALAAILVLGACVRLVPPVKPPPPAGTALEAGVFAGPAISGLRIDPADASGALASFRESCPRLTARSDASALTQGADWKPACDAAGSWPNAGAAGFFERFFEAVRIGDGAAFATGYYEPEIAGVRVPPAGLRRAGLPDASRSGACQSW